MPGTPVLQKPFDFDVGFLHRDAGAFEAEILGVADDADGGNHPVDGYFFGFAGGSMEMVTLSVDFCAGPSLAPVMIFMPCFSRALRKKAEISASSTGMSGPALRRR